MQPGGAPARRSYRRRCKYFVSLYFFLPFLLTNKWLNVSQLMYVKASFCNLSSVKRKLCFTFAILLMKSNKGSFYRSLRGRKGGMNNVSTLYHLIIWRWMLVAGPEIIVSINEHFLNPIRTGGGDSGIPPPPPCGFCPLLRKSSGNPYLKFLD